jgi:hypothetical protein
MIRFEEIVYAKLPLCYLTWFSLQADLAGRTATIMHRGRQSCHLRVSLSSIALPWEGVFSANCTANLWQLAILAGRNKG